MFITTDDERKLFDEGIVLSANKLIPSKVYVDDEEDYQFSADLYATTDTDNENLVFLHFRVFDGTSDDFEQALFFESKKISEISLQFEQECNDEDEARFIFDTASGVNIVFLNGETQKIKNTFSTKWNVLFFASKFSSLTLLES